LYKARKVLMARAKEIAEAVERTVPDALAEDWDNAGLQVGDLDSEANRVLVALTPVAEVFEEAEEIGADFLLFHHPLIFGGMDSLDTASYPGDLVARAVKNNLTIYAAHTNYDAAPGGVSVALAEALGLAGPLEVVAPRGSMRKLVVFVPEENVDTLADALTEAGAGVIGEYTHCTFRSPGTGTFFGGELTNPHAGEKGRLERVPELRLETVVPAHLYLMDGYPEGCGYGRVGRLPEQPKPEELRESVSGSLGFPARLVANPEPARRIERVAVLGGSGGSFVREAASSGADAYITGDLDYHDALLAESLGLAAVDAGHAATELPSLEPLARRLAELVDTPVSVSHVRR
jgi:dinuclear metal center YbgI/SA1388 family protein